MSSTNKTTNYELSQFIGTDKPAWLTDYNADMSKIDTAVHSVSSTATGADGKADANATSIGTLSNLTTTAKTNLVAAINEVDSNADTAQNTATLAATAANGAKDTADTLAAYLAITQTAKISPSVSGGTIGNINDMYYALNAGGTLGKIYGRLRITATASSITVTLPVSPLAVSSQFTIAGAAWYASLNTSTGDWTLINARDMTVNTNGTVTISWSNITVGESISIWLPPCLYFFTDFGDLPEE